MGIHGLMKLLSEECPDAIKEHDGLAPLTGRKVAIDASMAMYQFLVAVRSTGGGGANVQLTNEAGEVTSHVQGMFNRTIRMMESGLKPCYVFDGKPPNMKSGELAKRLARRAKAETDLAAAKEAGEAEDVDRFSRRLVKVNRQHNEDCKTLLRLMGVPVVDAPCEAEAQCAELAKAGHVWATATEDMDALTFRTPKLIRKLTYSQASKDKKQPIIEIDCEKILIGMGLTYEQFVDLCIMCGCDYTNTIKGIGPKNALKLVREHKNIEAIIAHLEKSNKYDIPPDWKEQRVSKKAMEMAEKLIEEARLAREAKEAEDQRARLVEALLQTPTVLGFSSGREKDENANAVDVNANEGEASAGVGMDAKPAATAIDATVEADQGMEEDEPEYMCADDAVDADDEEVMEGKPEEDASAPGAATKLEPAEPEVEEEIDDDDLEIIPPQYIQARSLFIQADVTPSSQIELKWSEPQIDALREYLVVKCGFNESRVQSGIDRLVKAQQKKSQQRMDSFFTSKPGSSSVTPSGLKRKADEKGAKKGPAKKVGGGAFAKKR